MYVYLIFAQKSIYLATVCSKMINMPDIGTGIQDHQISTKHRNLAPTGGQRRNSYF